MFDLPAMPQDQKRIVEEMDVVNVLVPVRVFHKGKPVPGLEKKNFQLFENGKLQEINTFQVFTRKIKRDSSKLVKLPGKKAPSRFFVLVFNVFDYNNDVDKAINKFFKNVYRETDKVVIVTPERTFNISNSREMLASMPVLTNMLKLYSKSAKNELNRIFKLLEDEVNRFFEVYFVDQASRTFLSNYQRLWKEFSRKYLIPDVNKFYWFADVLKRVNMEKWVIVFQQREVFPQFKARSRIKKRIQDWIDGHPMKPTTPLLEQLLYKMDYIFKVSENFPLEKIQEAFFRANATFHVLLFRSSKSDISQDFEYKEAVSDYENSFRSISRATGGDVILTNKLVESLDQVSRRQDVYYILSYAPKEIDHKNRKIKVKVSDENGTRKLNVFYIKNLQLNPEVAQEDEGKKVDVANFSFKQRLLTFSLVNYLQGKIKEKTIGVVEVRVMLMDSKTETVVFDQAKILEAKEAQTTIRIPFNALKKGKYHLILDLTDKLSNQSRIFTEKVRI
jgi:hypothetical protein